MSETLALILAGGRGSRLDILSEKRSKPAVPFAGKFRIIKLYKFWYFPNWYFNTIFTIILK